MRRLTGWLVPVLAPAAVAAPLLLTDRSFGTDLSDHTWLILQQALNLKGLGHPGYFVQSDLGAFLPWYSFYGGTFYALAGGLARLLGDDAVASVTLVMLAALAMAQGGWSWLARQAGLRGWVAHVPGAIYVTSAYYVTNAYGRGDVPELVATSSLPLLVAAGVRLARGPRWTPGPVLAFALVAVVFAGTHSITLIYGTLFLAALAVIALLAHGRPAHALRRRTAGLAGLAVLAVAVNAWFLVPVALFRDRVMISLTGPRISSGEFTTLGYLLRPWRDYPRIFDADIDTQLPILAILWCIVLAAVLRRRAAPQQRIWFAGLAALLAAAVAVMADPAPLGLLPRPLKFIQFPYRLETYALLCVSGLVLVVALALREAQRPRLALPALAAVLAVNVVLALVQGFGARSYLPDRDAAVASVQRPPARTWYIGRDYADVSAPVVRPELPGRLVVPTAGPRRSSYTARLPASVTRAGTIATNVATGSYLVDVVGAQPVGRLADGSMAVRVDPRAARVVRFEGAHGAELRAGQVVSVVALALLLAVLAGVALAGRRR